MLRARSLRKPGEAEQAVSTMVTEAHFKAARAGPLQNISQTAANRSLKARGYVIHPNCCVSTGAAFGCLGVLLPSCGTLTKCV